MHAARDLGGRGRGGGAYGTKELVLQQYQTL